MIDLGRTHVMVVDDNYHMTHLVKLVLRGLHVGNVTTIPDAPEAISRLSMGDVDIVITDWMMTPLDGIDFVRIIRTAKDSPDPFIPIIMLTGHSELHRVNEARDAGIDEFLIKPFSAKALYRRLEAIVINRRPFVRFSNYFGPDRRRRETNPWTKKERRKGNLQGAQPPKPKPPEAMKQDPRGLSQAELAALLGRKGEQGKTAETEKDGGVKVPGEAAKGETEGKAA
ncbi:MAG: response regulator [Alphaproteobacteria bacterium]